MEIKSLYYDLGNAVKGICDKTYARNRPASVEERINSYIVVRIPYRIYNEEMNSDGVFNDYTTTIQLEVYVRDMVSARNPNGFDISEIDEKVKAVVERFPISTDHIVVTKPQITLQGNDGAGFGVVIIQGSLRTK